jgi:tetratricopeptide (TPR) repeat protein
MEPKWEIITESGWKHKDNGTKLIQYFTEIVEKYPKSARALFELANAYDYLGKEGKAIPLYEKAIQMGLTSDYEAYTFLQLGSSLRNVGRVDDAIRVLTDAEARYPELPSISMFLGIAMHDTDRHSEALRTVLTAMLRHLKTPDMDRYKMGLNNYIKNIMRYLLQLFN